jgi:uncharacterized protein (TIGR02646 family)
LTEWRGPRLVKDRNEGMQCTYEELRKDPAALEAVEDGLFEEQGGICAYTGLRIRLKKSNRLSGGEREVDFHLEHLLAQAHCRTEATYGQDAAYENLVACWPRPNCGFEPAYGARKKGQWPSPAELHRFVSPLDKTCTKRFRFNQRGEISAARDDDTAAKETIEKLGLDDDSLMDLRRSAIRGALNPRSGLIKLKDARKLLRQMKEDAAKLDQGVPVQLAPFCFAIEQALEHEIRKLEGIMEQGKQG